MFYYPAVLRRHTGCFSTIWLVATKGIRVTRRDFLKVNVMRTCNDIINYVLEKVPPPLPDLPQPRFSLYLSSQLQYGVVLVYHRQCVILLEELQSILGRLSKQKAQKIDIDDHSRQVLDFPDALSLMEEAEGAPDPLFGVMHMPSAMPSPNTLIEMGQDLLREASPEIPEQASFPAAAALESITASPETITLRETEPITIPLTEFEGEDLVNQQADTIAFLLDQSDPFPEGDLEVFREAQEEQEREMDRAYRERGGTTEPTGSTIELQPTATLSGEDAMLLPQEEPGLPTDMITPISAPPLPSPLPAAREDERLSLELEAVPPAEMEKQKRKRQLIFFDPETQIPQDVLQRQINNPQAETRPLSYPPPSPHSMLPAAELLNTPCIPLPAEVLFLWKRAVTVTPVSGSDLRVGERGPESTDSERERQEEVLEAAEDEQLELSPKEVPRDVAESEMFYISAHGLLPLEATNQTESSQETFPTYAPEREEPPVSRSVSTLQDIPEVPDEVLEGAAAEPLGLLPEATEHEEAPVLFHSLLPPKADRRTVSNIFQRLLETLSSRRVRVEQNELYGDIWISQLRRSSPEGDTVTVS